MKTSPFSPWSGATPESDASTGSSDSSADALRQAAEQLTEAVSRISSLSSPDAPGGGSPSAVSVQITVATPLGEPLPFTSDAGPDLTLLS